VDPMGREVYRCLWMERASTRQASRWGSHQQQGAPIAHTIFFPGQPTNLAHAPMWPFDIDCEA